MKDRNGWPIEPGDLVRIAETVAVMSRYHGSVGRVVAEWKPSNSRERDGLARLGHYGPFVLIATGKREQIMACSYVERTAPRTLKPSGLTLDEIIEELNQ